MIKKREIYLFQYVSEPVLETYPPLEEFVDSLRPAVYKKFHEYLDISGLFTLNKRKELLAKLLPVINYISIFQNQVYT